MNVETVFGIVFILIGLGGYAITRRDEERGETSTQPLGIAATLVVAIGISLIIVEVFKP